MDTSINTPIFKDTSERIPVRSLIAFVVFILGSITMRIATADLAFVQRQGYSGETALIPMYHHCLILVYGIALMWLSRSIWLRIPILAVACLVFSSAVGSVVTSSEDAPASLSSPVVRKQASKFPVVVGEGVGSSNQAASFWVESKIGEHREFLNYLEEVEAGRARLMLSLPFTDAKFINELGPSSAYVELEVGDRRERIEAAHFEKRNLLFKLDQSFAKAFAQERSLKISFYGISAANLYTRNLGKQTLTREDSLYIGDVEKELTHDGILFMRYLFVKPNEHPLAFIY